RSRGDSGRKREGYEQWKLKNCQQTYDNFTIHISNSSSGDGVSCKRAQINPPTACHVMERMLNDDAVYCSKPNNFTLCEQRWDIDSNVYRFNCSFIQSNCALVYLGTISLSTGDISWKRVPGRNIDKLEKLLVEISTIEDFVFVRCGLLWGKLFSI
ncbi:uncharacterized protein LOC142355316, partial [Convolutriloba macropyga]|uniref:uncharacterized protein LOC142355316 n=1 Tax=Convolutriloba macropyga TaxID=536237 RepID=UPI003F5200D1